MSIYVNNNVKIHEAQLIELKNEIEKSTTRVGDLKTLLWVTDRSSNNIVGLNNIINLLALTDIYKILHPIWEYTFFFQAHIKTFTNIDHILGYKTQHI